MLALKRFIVLVFLALAMPAYAGQATTLRMLVEEIAVSFPRNELRACAVAHPEQAERFNASAARFSERIDGLLTEMAAVQASLAEPVPAEFLDFQLSLATMDDSDFRTRSTAGMPESDTGIRCPAGCGAQGRHVGNGGQTGRNHPQLPH